MPQGKQRALSANARTAAFLEGTGLTGKEIIAQLGINRVTLTDWRRREDWQALKEDWHTRSMERLAPMIERLKLHAIDAHEEAIAVLVEGLRSETVGDNPMPNWPVRIAAADKIINSPIIKGSVDPRQPTGDKGQVSGITAVSIRIVRDDEGKETIEKVDYIDHDGEAEEILEIGPGDAETDDPADDDPDGPGHEPEPPADEPEPEPAAVEPEQPSAIQIIVLPPVNEGDPDF